MRHPLVDVQHAKDLAVSFKSQYRPFERVEGDRLHAERHRVRTLGHAASYGHAIDVERCLYQQLRTYRVCAAHNGAHRGLALDLGACHVAHHEEPRHESAR